MLGYKLLTAEGRSITIEHGGTYYDLTGEWQKLPERGTRVGLTVPAILRGGLGPLLAELECQDVVPGGHNALPLVRKVRITRTATVDRWMLVRAVLRAARDASIASKDPRIEAAIEAATFCEQERTWESADRAIHASFAVRGTSRLEPGRIAGVAAGMAALAATRWHEIAGHPLLSLGCKSLNDDAPIETPRDIRYLRLEAWSPSPEAGSGV